MHPGMEHVSHQGLEHGQHLDHHALEHARHHELSHQALDHQQLLEQQGLEHEHHGHGLEHSGVISKSLQAIWWCVNLP